MPNMATPHQHFRHERPRVVGARLHRAVGAGRHDGDELALRQPGHLTVAGM